MEKPVLVTLMHCWAEVPQRLFCTTYRPWMVVLPNWSQIWVSAWAGLVTIAVAMAAAASTPAAAAARMARLIDGKLSKRRNGGDFSATRTGVLLPFPGRKGETFRGLSAGRDNDSWLIVSTARWHWSPARPAGSERRRR